MDLFFILSKVTSILLEPVIWIVLIVIVRACVRSTKIKRILGITAVVVFLIFSNEWILVNAEKAWASVPSRLDPGKKYSCGILLTGVTVPSKDTAYFGWSSDRFIEALKLYKQGIVAKLLVTGGSGLITNQVFREADFLKEQLMKMGVPESDIITERNSRNTYENAVFSKRILDSLRLPPPYVLITSEYHMRRSVLVFRKAGYSDVEPCFSDYLRPRPTKWRIDNLLLPNSLVLVQWNVLIREVIGVIAYKLTGKA